MMMKGTNVHGTLVSRAGNASTDRTDWWAIRAPKQINKKSKWKIYRNITGESCQKIPYDKYDSLAKHGVLMFARMLSCVKRFNSCIPSRYQPLKPRCRKKRTDILKELVRTNVLS